MKRYLIIKNKQTKKLKTKMEQIQQLSQTITSDLGKVNSIWCHVW